MDPQKAPTLGERLRSHFSALGHPNAHIMQLKMVDSLFAQYAARLDEMMPQEVATVDTIANNQDKAYATARLISYFTQTSNPDSGQGFSPTITIPMPINTCFTRFSAADIRALPGYIKLHEVARRTDFAVYVSNLVSSDDSADMETLAHRQSPNASVHIDLRKSYLQGLQEDEDQLAPCLPQDRETFDPTISYSYERVRKIG